MFIFWFKKSITYLLTLTFSISFIAFLIVIKYWIIINMEIPNSNIREWALNTKRVGIKLLGPAVLFIALTTIYNNIFLLNLHSYKSFARNLYVFYITIWYLSTNLIYQWIFTRTFLFVIAIEMAFCQNFL